MNADYFDKIFSEGNYDCLSTSSSIDKVALKKIHEMRALRPLFVKLDRTVRVSKYSALVKKINFLFFKNRVFGQKRAVRPAVLLNANARSIPATRLR